MWTTGGADALVRGAAGSAILGAIVGLGIGVAQCLVLRRELASGRLWIPVTIAAWAAAWAAGQTITELLLDDYWLLGLVPGAVLLAGFVAVSQWLVLRRSVHRASVWLPTSLVGWAAAGMVSMYGGAGLFAMGLAAFLGPVGWLFAAVPGIFAGLITGAALVGLLPRAIQPL
jgi:hypothetical protein